MKKEFRFLHLSALATGLLTTLPTLAATYYCDNDRAASQYPYCRVASSSNWTYYSGHSYDYNRDDRRARSGGSSTYYNWIFKRNKYSASVYLNNTAFTDPRADYLLFTPSSTSGEVTEKVINQNTASGGWHAIGTANFDTIAVVSLSSSGNYILGADGVKVSSVSTAANTLSASASSPSPSLENDDVVDTSASCGAIASQSDPRIAAIQQKMLNASSSYRDIAGRFRTFFSNIGQDDMVDFQVSEAQGRSMVRSTDGKGGVMESAFDGATFVVRHPLEKSYRSFVLSAPADAYLQQPSSFATEASARTPRFYRNGRCEAVFVHREDPAHAASASEVTDPQNYAFWLYDSPSRIAGHEILLGRAVTVIEGRQDDYLRRKLGVTTFTMWVDDATGVLLKLVGKNETGQFAYFIEASSIAVDKNLQLPARVTDVPAGWKLTEVIPHATAGN